MIGPGSTLAHYEITDPLGKGVLEDADDLTLTPFSRSEQTLTLRDH